MAIMSVSHALPYPNELEQSVKILFGESSTKSETFDLQASYGDQSLFTEWKKRCTDDTLSYFQQARQDLAKGFFIQLMQRLGRERNSIAQQMKSPSAEKFGLLRTVDLENSTVTHLTAPRYREFNQKIRNQFANSFLHFQQNLDPVVVETDFSRSTLEIIDRSKLQEMVLIIGRKPHSEEEVLKANERIALLNSIAGVSDLVYGLQLPHLQQPDKPDIGPMKIGPLQFLVNTIESKIKGKWKTMTRHLLWLNQSEAGPITNQAIDYFKRCGFVTLLHSSKADLPFHLEAIENLTKELITSQYENPRLFKRDLGVWEFRLCHSMPFYRGSQSVLEILREAICRFQNQEVPNRTDADALSSTTLESYLKLRT